MQVCGEQLGDGLEMMPGSFDLAVWKPRSRQEAAQSEKGPAVIVIWLFVLTPGEWHGQNQERPRSQYAIDFAQQMVGIPGVFKHFAA
jgi:hypothetical protein